MKKLIAIAVGVLLLCMWSGLFIAVYGDLPPISGEWKSYQIAFVMIETPIMIILFAAGLGCTLRLWKTYNGE